MSERFPKYEEITREEAILSLQMIAEKMEVQDIITSMLIIMQMEDSKLKDFYNEVTSTMNESLGAREELLKK